MKPRRKSKENRPDFVPHVRWARGEVFLEDHADPARPLRAADGVQTGFHTIRGVRAAQGGHDYLVRRGSLDNAQHAAAARYCNAWHGTQRSGCAMAGVGSVRLPAHQQGHPSMAMVDCATDIRDAAAALGQGARILVHQVTVQGYTLSRIGDAAGESDKIALGRLKAALDRLAEVWGIETP